MADCNCNKTTIPICNVVDLTKVESFPYEDAKYLTAISECGKPMFIEKPVIPEPSSGFIPLQGTEEGQHVTGDIVTEAGIVFTYDNLTRAIQQKRLSVNKEGELVYNGDIHIDGNFILNNDNKILGTDLNGVQHNLIECSRFTSDGSPIIDIGGAGTHLNTNSIDTPTNQLADESGENAHKYIFSSDLENYALKSEIPNMSSYVDISSTQTITGIKRFNNTLTTTNILPSSNLSRDLGSTQFLYNNAYINNIYDSNGTHYAKITDLQQTSKVFGDLSATDSSLSLTFDGITGTVTNDGTFISMVFTSATQLTGVNLVRTVFASSNSGTQRLDNQTLNSTNPVSFPSLTAGANPKIQIDIIVSSTQTIYKIEAWGTTNLTSCAAYVTKL